MMVKRRYVHSILGSSAKLMGIGWCLTAALGTARGISSCLNGRSGVHMLAQKYPPNGSTASNLQKVGDMRSLPNIADKRWNIHWQR